MNPFATLLVRHSTPSRQLGTPGPDRGQLLRMLEVAVHVPDHGRLAPWRFVQISGGARAALGRALALRLIELDPEASEAKIIKERERFNHAPCVIAVVATPTPGHKVPESEQIQSGSCVCFSLLQAAYDPQILLLLGVRKHESILGFIHIGKVIASQPDRDRPDAASLLTDWLHE
jgi:nitroreductase